MSARAFPAPALRPTERLAVALFRRFPPAGDTIFKEPERRAAQEYASEDYPDGFRRHFHERFPGLLVDADVLDLGCGFGGRTVKFLEYGARSVLGIEVTAEHVRRGEAFAAERGAGDRVRFAVGTGEDIPCPDGSFDLITLMDVMEHVIDPGRVLAECHRVLRPGGRVALVFPPYYDLTEGSHLHGYATRLPGLNLVFSTSALRTATRRLVEERGIEFERYFRDVPTDKLWNQNGLTVREWERVAERSPLSVEWTYLMGHLQYRRLHETGSLFGHSRPLYRAAQGAAQIRPVRELTCSRICAVLRK
jgi:SAM-dependent methyltransferase